jgi:hypothetical protein
MGLIFDSRAHAVRPVVGVPGAAYAGGPLISDSDAAWVAPDGSAALVMRAGRLELYSGLKGVRATVTVLDGALGDIPLVAWAADAGAVAVYSAKSAQIQIFTLVSQAPSAGAVIDGSGLPGRVSALAFDGRTVLIALASDYAGGIYAISAGSVPQRLASSPNPSAMVVAGPDVYFADGQSQQIWQVQSYAGRPATVLFNTDSSVLSAPVGIEISPDGKRLYVADSGTRKLAVYDTSTRALVRSLDLSFTPTVLNRLDRSVLVLDTAGQDDGPLHVLSDGGSDEAAVYFVPIQHRAAIRRNQHRPNP